MSGIAAGRLRLEQLRISSRRLTKAPSGTRDADSLLETVRVAFISFGSPLLCSRGCQPRAQTAIMRRAAVAPRLLLVLAGVVARIEQRFAAAEPVEEGVGLVAGARAADQTLVGG